MDADTAGFRPVSPRYSNVWGNPRKAFTQTCAEKGHAYSSIGLPLPDMGAGTYDITDLAFSSVCSMGGGDGQSRWTAGFPQEGPSLQVGVLSTY